MMQGLSSLISIKYGALLLLIAQNTFLVILMRISRTAGGDMYLSSTAVVSMETLKLISCFGVLAYQKKDKGLLLGLKQAIRDDSLFDPMEILKLSVPSVLYVIQNNLLYYALSHLDAATYLVGYQLKILTTAVFSSLMLDRALSRLQWLSLVLLTFGVSLAQLHASNSHAAAAAKEMTDHPLESQNSLAGFCAVFVAACTSGFAGIYFEKVVKTSATSLWVRNIQLGLSSMLFAIFGVWMSDGAVVAQKGFFFGYSNIVIAVVFLQAVGGLVVAVVVKYADNILKGFAASLSIITSCVVSYLFLDFQPSLPFAVGAALVLVSSFIYEKGLPTHLNILALKHTPWIFVKPSPKIEGVGGGGSDGNALTGLGQGQPLSVGESSALLDATKNV